MFQSTALFHSPPAGKDKWNYPSINRKSDPSVSNTRGFKRLDSLDSDCHSSRSSSYDSSVASKMNSEKVVDQKLPPNSSSKESKWFGYYPQSDQSVGPSATSSSSASHQKMSGKFQNHYTAAVAPASRPAFSQPQVHLYNHSHHHQQPWTYYQQPPPPSAASYQVPYNLTKGHFEVWPMEQMMQQGCYLQQPSMPFNQGHGGHQEWGQGTITRCVNYIYEGASNLISAMSTSLSFSTTLAGGQPPRVLNPNAKSFTPLNPNAKEFHPSSGPTSLISSDDQNPVPKERENLNSNISNEKDSSTTVTPPNGLLQVEDQENCLQITPEIKCEMKSIAYRKCTPWIPKIPVKSKDQQKQQQSREIPPSDISFSEDDHEDLEDSDDDDDDDDEGEDDGSVSKRSRLLSQCSSESGSFIQFGSEEIPRCTKSPPRIPDKPSPFLANFLVGGGHDDEDDEDDSEDEDDSDHFGSWDSSIDAIVLDDPDMLAELGLQCQWQIPSHVVVKSVDTVDHHQKNTEFEEDIDQEDSHFLLLDEFHLSRNDHNEILKQIKDANERWSSNNSENCKQTADDNLESIIEERKTKVTFAEPLVTHVTYVIPIIRKADLDRFERLLKPIFGSEHRQKMRSYIADNSF